MRKNLIALSVAAFVGGLGLAGSATAAVFADDATGCATCVTNATAEVVRQSGTGHQLIVPYFNTQAGNATLINIVNTDQTNGKAVKVRFRGASNSDDVFDFQLFLSAGDVWTANVAKGPNGVSRLTTTDKSCTLPAGVGSGAASTSDFVTARLPQTLTGDDLFTQTREGYVEIFNMGDIPPNTASGSLSKAITHVAGVPPCASMPAAMGNDPANLAAVQTLGIRSPSATLFANWTIVNVPKSGSATGEATAITATTGAPAVPGRGNIVFFPQTSNPAAGGTTPVDSATADPLLRSTAGVTVGDVSNGTATPGAAFAGTLPAITASMFDLPDMSTPYITTVPIGYTGPALQALALSKALATSSITNEFLTDTTINAFTDWTFSSPTRRYNVVADYRGLSATPPTIARAYLTTNANGTNDFYANSNTSVAGFQICVTTAGVQNYDREEANGAGTSFVISPNPPAPTFRLCGEVSTMTFNAPSGASVLGSTIAKTNFNPVTFGGAAIRDGWAVVGMPGLASTIGAVGGFNGLPIIGKSFSAASTGTFNVGGSWEHRYTPTFP